MSLKRFRQLKSAQREPRAPNVEIVPAEAGALRHLGAIGPEALLKHFLQGRSPNTLAAYTRDLAVFARHLQLDVREAVNVLLGTTQGQANALVLEWANTMTGASSTRARRLGTLRSLTKLARMLGVITWALSIQGPHVETYRDTRGPALETIHKMLATCGEDHEGRRNRVILLFLAALGLRRTELITLRLSDYDQVNRRVHVIGKGAKEVWVTLPATVVEALHAWIDNSEWHAAKDAPLVCSLAHPGAGAPLSRQGLNWIVGTIGKRAGVKAWPHGLRHAGITLGLDSHDIRHVRKFSRHANVQTVMIYDDNREDLGAMVADTVARKLTEGLKND